MKGRQKYKWPHMWLLAIEGRDGLFGEEHGGHGGREREREYGRDNRGVRPRYMV